MLGDKAGPIILVQVEDAPSGSGYPGVVLLAVRNDAGGTLVDENGDYTALITDGQGRLRVTGAGGSFSATVTQATHDSLNANANVQQNDVDVATGNALYVQPGTGVTFGQAAATTPAIYNVTMTNADTEYSQALAAGTKRFSLQCQSNSAIRFAFVTGKVATPTAPYALLRAGMNYSEQQVSLTSVTLYVASPAAGKVAEIICWS